MSPALVRAITHDSLGQVLLADGRPERPYARSVEMPEGSFLLAAPKHKETPAARTFVEWIGEEFAGAGLSVREFVESCR